jgi:hypothetical protein
MLRVQQGTDTEGIEEVAVEEEHWPERFCECEQCREWYREQALEWAEYDERETSP